MDTICPRCGEPSEVLYITDTAKELGLTPREAHAKFANEGCGFLGFTCTPVKDERTEVAALLYDLLGDDVDGVAAMLEDFGFS